jgi:hypothetical protein
VGSFLWNQNWTSETRYIGLQRKFML